MEQKKELEMVVKRSIYEVREEIAKKKAKQGQASKKQLEELEKQRIIEVLQS